MTRTSKLTITFVVLAVLIVVALVVLVELHSNRKGSYIDGAPVTGTLYLTLESPADANSNGNTYLNTFTYNLASNKLAPYFTDSNRNITAVLSPDGTQLAYFSRANTDPIFELFVKNIATGRTQQLTLDANKFKREPTWSHDGSLIAYSVESQATSSNPLVPNAWGVFLVNPSGTLGNEYFAGVGIDPFFSPDGKTLYSLQNDGIHATDLTQLISAQQGKKVLPASTLAVPSITGTTTRASQTMKISVSPDGTHLAWSVPMQGYTDIFKVTSWSPLALTLEKNLPIAAFYSVFSPDSQYVALEQVDVNAQNIPSNPGIVIYHLGDYTYQKVLDLSQYSPTYLWLSSWQ
jgi:Tol biopolymer transport system component